MQIMSPR